ncbi:hypothetical protein FRC18_000722 [Serendipita sp. 400]|nr:hypothetical protein FRC18_000722 [Serendipita sp. 400]
MNDHNNPAQVQSRPNGTPPTAANFVLDTLTGQHKAIIEHLNATINGRFNEIYEVCQTILQQQTILNSDHRHLVTQLEEMRQSDLNYRKELSSILTSRLPEMESSLGGLDRKVDLLAYNLRQLDQRVNPLEDGLREVDLTTREILRNVKDSRLVSGLTPSQVLSNNHLLRYPETPTFPLDAIFEMPQSTLNEFSVQSINPNQLKLVSYNNSAGGQGMLTQNAYSQTPDNGHQSAAPTPGPEAGLPQSNVESYPTPESPGDMATDDMRQTASPSPPSVLTQIGKAQGPQHADRQRRSSNRLQSSLKQKKDAQNAPLPSPRSGSESSELTEMDIEEALIPRSGQPPKTTRSSLENSQHRSGVVAPLRRRSTSFAPKPVVLQPPKRQFYKRKRRVGARLERRSIRKDAMVMRGAMADIETTSHIDYEMIGCDGCDRWYHRVCVKLDRSIIETMDGDSPYHCPACPPRSDLLFAKPNPTREGGCSSRQCIIGDDGFSIDNLVGRKPDPANAGNYLWLIKWYGFGVEDSTWKPTVTFDSTALIVEWYEAAQKEGHSQKYLASQESESDVILIGDAKGKGPWPESDD